MSNKSVFLHLYTKLFAKKSLYNFHLKLYRIALRGLGINNYNTWYTQGEYFFLEKILPKYKPNTVFDVGANVGHYTTSLLKVIPNANVYCFEPNPNTYRSLENALKKQSRVKTFPIGLSSTPGTFTLYDTPQASTAASLHKEVFYSQKNDDVLEHQVECSTIDIIADCEQVEKIDFLKIDTEGNELAVLRGAKQVLETDRVSIIHFEFNEMNVISRVFFRDFVKLLPSYNFY
ncbi:MAG: FkbM family methyltransferase, partial [Bacteroidales bacterium]